jgi:hypothetical protein
LRRPWQPGPLKLDTAIQRTDACFRVNFSFTFSWKSDVSWFQIGPEPRTLLFKNTPGLFFAAIKRPEHVADPSTPSTAEIKNNCRCTSTPLIHLCDVERNEPFQLTSQRLCTTKFLATLRICTTVAGCTNQLAFFAQDLPSFRKTATY